MFAHTPLRLSNWTHAPILFGALFAPPAFAQDVNAVGQAFADHCFSPHLTAETARDALAPSGARIDFYDLRPFSDAPPSPVTGRAATPGTDRRCEVAHDGNGVTNAQMWVTTGLNQERLQDRQIAVPKDFPIYPGTQHSGAVQLNPDRIAVVQMGLRDGPNGTETFINVERLIPLSEGGT